MRSYNQNIEDVLSYFKSGFNGLTSLEASERLQRYGKNRLSEAKKESTIKRFFKQLTEPMTIILLIAAAISAIVEIYEGIESGHIGFPADVVIILAVVIINAVLGVLQESKAEKAIEALQEISAATCKVIRDGKLTSIRSEELVIGDIIVLEAGDAVPADSRIIECASLQAEESALTGESLPVSKTKEIINEENTTLGERRNSVFMGTVIVYGRAKAVVTATGMDTEMGKIADAIAKTREGKTPLQIKLSQLSKILTVLVIIISITIFGINIVRELVNFGAVTLNKLLDFFMVAVSLAVAAIPEGLSTVVTIVLSIGVTNMSKRNAIIRKLTAVETLGCTQIICSDKTGTLTQNKMTVIEHFADDELLLATSMSLCSDAEYDNESGEAIGEPTECALVNYAEKIGINTSEQSKLFTRINEIPFDSSRKMMSTIHNDSKNGGIIQFTKGATDEILARCSHILIDKTEVVLTDQLMSDTINLNKTMANKALRVLGCAYKRYDTPPNTDDSKRIEYNMCFIGLVGMMDPIRTEVKSAIEECRLAGIRPIMITGDHKDTAIAIADQLNILSDPSQAITGSELDRISDEEFFSLVDKYSVYARVQPEHKTRIVNAWQYNGMITAMTGDGVNDAPSIKNADIGIGMGITGTDVTKNVADMILSDDNFATIVSAVGEGRRIYNNIRKAIQFLLASNLSEVLTIFFATLLGIENIFLAVHLLWINLITDCLPALALGMEKSESDIMRKPPRNSSEGIFANGLGVAIIYQGLFVTIITLTSYFIGYNYLATSRYANMIASGIYNPQMIGTSMAFLTLSMAEIFHSLNMRSLHGSIFKLKNQNFWLISAGVLSLILTFAVIEIDFLSSAFSLVDLDIASYGIALLLSIIIIPIVELAKLIGRIRKK